MPAPTSAAPMNEQAIGLAACLVDLADAAGDRLDVGHRLRREDHQHLVDVRVVQHGLQGRRVAVGPGVADHVHGVLHVGRGGQRAAQPAPWWPSARRGTRSPTRMAASVAITPGPPALVTIARRLPAGSGW